MSAPITELLAEVESLGARVTLVGPNRLHAAPVAALPPELIEELRARKAEIVATLEGWPAECVEEIRRFGKPHARLFPLLGRTVNTTQGTGRLIQAFGDRAAVAVGGRTVFFDVDDVAPLPPRGPRA